MTHESREGERIPVTIETATGDDARDIIEVFYRAWLDTYVNEEHGVTREDIEAHFAPDFTDGGLKARQERYGNHRENETILVAKVDGRAVGVCRALLHDKENEIRALYVHPDFHRMGIGKKLWEAARAYFDSKKETMLHVASYNERAQGFYESLGFSLTDTVVPFEERFRMPSGAIIPQAEMRRPADTP